MSVLARSFTFLVNPASGGGAAPGAALPVARLLREAGARVDVTYSPGPAAMADLVRAAVDRDDVVVSVGGDGMLSSLAGVVAAAGGVLGVLPAGRGNDFARMLGLPTDAAGLARTLLDGPLRQVDLLRCEVPGSPARVVAGSVYAGVDARAAEIVHGMRRVPARLQYPVAALRALATYRPAAVRAVVDGATHEFRAATVVVANSCYYGKGMRVAPDACLDDGLLDLVVVEAVSKLALIRSLPTIYDGSHVALPEVTVLRGRHVELSADAGADADPPLPLGGDGEPLGVLPRLGAAPTTVEVLPGALRLVGP